MVSYKLHAVIKAAVNLDIDTLFAFIGDSEEFISIVTVFACAVYRRLNDGISLRIAIEYRSGLVAVVMDRAFLVCFIVIALTAIIISAPLRGGVSIKKQPYR